MSILEYMKKLENKIALVTGASKGIGAEIAKNMAKEGAKVIVNYNTDKKGADKVVSEIKAQGGNAFSVKADVTKKDQIEMLFKTSNETYGRITTLINNAGIGIFPLLGEITEQHLIDVYNTNVFGLILLTQEMLPIFMEIL